jgi:hypothetical protein
VSEGVSVCLIGANFVICANVSKRKEDEEEERSE